MEVHAHTHTPRKKWTHYFWEFLMLFLAVFCGFMAENIREHQIERKREKQYIQSLLQDLKQDTTFLNFALGLHDKGCKMIDTLILLLKSKDRNQSAGKIYFLARSIPFNDIPIVILDKTFDQLKSSGTLRLIHNVSILDSISAYYGFYKFMSQAALPMEARNRQELFLGLEKLFDMKVFQDMAHSENPLVPEFPLSEPTLLSNDEGIINSVCARYHFMYSTRKVIQNETKRLNAAAKRLIMLLKKEYHLN